MSVTFVTSGQANGGASSATTASATVNIGTCDTVCFSVQTSALSAQTFTVQTWNGVTLTKIAGASIVESSSGTTDWFALTAPATGSHTVQFTWNNAGLWVVGFESFSGADQTGGTTTFNNGTTADNVASQGTSITKAVTSSNGDASVFAWVTVNTFTGQTQTPTADWQLNTNLNSEGQHILSVSSSDSYTAVMNTPADIMFGAGFHIKAAAGAADVLQSQIIM